MCIRAVSMCIRGVAMCIRGAPGVLGVYKGCISGVIGLHDLAGCIRDV